MALDLSRRRFFGILAAPAIVRAASLMPVRAFLPGLEPEMELSIGQIRDLLLPGIRQMRYAGLAQLKTEGSFVVFDNAPS